ncbi:MAG: universal stress protein [Xanthomonadales bacterium]|nr:universal stress protein [Xanthomonadales bacterium]
MSGTIIVGIDGSSGSQRALGYAIMTARQAGEKLLIVSVIPHSPHAFMSVREMEGNESWRKQQTAHAENEVLAPARAKAEAAEVATEIRVAFGNPAEVLSKMASENSASRVVVGRRGQSQLKAMVFGSVSGSLAQISPVPVVVVP